MHEGTNSPISPGVSHWTYSLDGLSWCRSQEGRCLKDAQSLGCLTRLALAHCYASAHDTPTEGSTLCANTRNQLHLTCTTRFTICPESLHITVDGTLIDSLGTYAPTASYASQCHRWNKLEIDPAESMVRKKELLKAINKVWKKATATMVTRVHAVRGRCEVIAPALRSPKMTFSGQMWCHKFTAWESHQPLHCSISKLRK